MNAFAERCRAVRDATVAGDQKRYAEAYVALMDEMPTSPTELAQQLRWLIYHTEQYPDACVYTTVLDNVADYLEKRVGEP